jgi:hypothetical protein
MRSRKEKTTKGQVSFLTSATLSSSSGAFFIGAQMCAVTQALASVYRLYRFNRVKVTLLPEVINAASANVGAIAVWYSPTLLNTAPTNVFDAEAQHMTVGSQTCRVPRSFTIPRDALRTVVDWFATEDDATETSLNRMGAVYIMTSTVSETPTLFFEVTVDYEFKEPLDAAVIGALLEEGRKAKEATPTPHSCRGAWRG